VLEEKDKVELFQFFCGYAFSGHYKYHKGLFLIGDGANGKSTLLDTLFYVFGHFNVSNIRLDQLGDKFLLIKLRGMLANIASESCERTAIESSVFKEVVSGGTLVAGDKFKSNISFRNNAKFFQAMNNFPVIGKKSHGVLRRLEFLSCDKDFSKSKKQDFDISKKLLNEAPGILNWCLDGLNMLNEEGAFITPKSSKLMLTKFTYETCSVTRFLNEEFSREEEFSTFRLTNDDSSVNKKVIYSQYNIYCRMNGLRPMSDVPFWKIFWKHFPDLRDYRCRKKGRCVKGVSESSYVTSQVLGRYS
jgi:putative DNA primase/helicase